MHFFHYSISCHKVVCVSHCLGQIAYVLVSFFSNCISPTSNVFAGPFQGFEVQIAMVGSLQIYLDAGHQRFNITTYYIL